jgi:hypothetical protein
LIGRKACIERAGIRLISEIDATAQIFKIHHIERLIFRIQLIEAGYSLLKALKVIYTIPLKKIHK